MNVLQPIDYMLQKILIKALHTSLHYLHLYPVYTVVFTQVLFSLFFFQPAQLLNHSFMMVSGEPRVKIAIYSQIPGVYRSHSFTGNLIWIQNAATAMHTS